MRIKKDSRLEFYIKPKDGFQLPQIMQLLKQTFAVRYNVLHNLRGHTWGDRYWSEILEGDPLKEAELWTGPVMGVEAAGARLCGKHKRGYWICLKNWFVPVPKAAR